MSRTKIPRITWGTSFANSLVFAVTFDRSITSSRPREGSSRLVISSGVEDNWNMGTDQLLEGTVRRIPTVDTGGITGWDGATGWRAAIEWMQDANIFRWIFDQDVLGTYQTMYLIEPSEGPSQFLESGYRTRGLFLKMRADDDTPITGY